MVQLQNKEGWKLEIKAFSFSINEVFAEYCDDNLDLLINNVVEVKELNAYRYGILLSVLILLIKEEIATKEVRELYEVYCQNWHT